MPSVNPKLEKQSSQESQEPIRQAIIVIEHRIRNLEKRKGKLESYRTIQRNGGELNADQKTAVAKFDEVQQSLEITREMYKQIVSIANDSAKLAKKLARKEALERMQQDISKVREVLLVQNTLANIVDKATYEDFLSGSNGAIQLTDEELKYLDSIHQEVQIKRSDEKVPLASHMQKVAEHLVAIVDGKQREVVGTTYNKIKEIVNNVMQSGYFDKQTQNSVETTVEEVQEAIETISIDNVAPQEQQVTEEYNITESHIPPSETLLPMPNFPAQVSPSTIVSNQSSNATGPVVPPGSVQPQSLSTANSIPSANIENSYYAHATSFVAQTQAQQQQQQHPSLIQPQVSPQPPRINEVIGTPNFFFLQESEIEASEGASQAQQQQQQQQQQQHQQQQQQQQQQPVISHISTASVSAPIPSQTFTNQSFVAAPSVPQQVIFQHQSQLEISHVPGFGNSNPPPPIPMPPSHQSSMQFSPPHPGYQHQQNQTFEQIHHQESILIAEEKIEDLNEQCVVDVEAHRPMEPTDWAQVPEGGANDWNQPEPTNPNLQDGQSHNPQQAWGDPSRTTGYRGRGGRRGNTNGYSGRSRGGYQQNGRGSYHRTEGTFQNGYQQRTWNSSEVGTGGFNPTFKSRGGNRGGQRGGERGSSDRGARGQFRSNSQRTVNNRGNFMTRTKVPAQN